MTAPAASLVDSMSATDTINPPVVAVMVVHEPGPWFTEVLDSLVLQDYANLRTLVLVSGDSDEAVELVNQRLPDAVIRQVAGDPGFGASANEVLDLVEGDNGFFCFLHDDVALERSTIRLLVEELYRSNAGIVGPKLVEWEDRRILQRVGLGVDAFGEVDTYLQPGEADQEQHDSVSDVFALPSACMLIRADLFRALRGFSPNIRFHGDDVELCWRAHLGGARSVVAPLARARHIGALTTRRPDLDHQAMAARNRMFTVATLTGAGRLPLVMIRHLTLTLGQLIVGLFTGTAGRAFDALRATVGLIPRVLGITARRRDVRPLRRVPSHEVASLQLRGSARLAAWFRNRGTAPVDPEASVERRWRQTAGSAPAVAWITLLVLLVVGSRQLITGRVPSFGQFLPFPSSPAKLLADFRSGWWSHGLGSADPAPTGAAMVALGSVLTGFHMGLWQTVCVVGLYLGGMLGMWRLGRLFPTARARIAGLCTYAAVPLPVALIAGGRWSALACYAALPWSVHLLRRCAGLESLGGVGDDLVEAYTVHEPRRQVRLFALLVLTVAVPAAFAPTYPLLVAVVAVVLGVAGYAVGSTWRASVSMAGHAAAAMVAAILLQLPWSRTWFAKGGWTSITGVAPAGGGGHSVFGLARFDLGDVTLGALALALYLPLLGALLLAKGWRFTWAVRGAALAIVFLVLAVLADRNALGVNPPEPGILLAPVAVGLALGAACFTAAMQDDVMVGGFGWRQPVGLLCTAGLGLGLVPGGVNVASGRWNTPRSTLLSVVGQLPTDPAEGNYRVLWLGDPRLMPVGAWTYRPGIAYALSSDGPLTIDDAWPGTPTDAERSVRDAIDAIADGTTFRAGRLLAPYAIRYVIIPADDGTSSEEPLARPVGLEDALDDQLDLGKPLLGPLKYVVYENRAWTPIRSVLSEAGAASSTSDDLGVIAATDLQGGTPFAVGAPDRGPATGEVLGRVLHVASPLDDNWRLTVDGQRVGARPAFGQTSAFDLPVGGQATLRHDTPFSRTLALVAQAILWALVVLAATRIDPLAWWRRRRGVIARTSQPVMTMDDEQFAMAPWHGGQPLDDVWGDG